MPEPLSRRAAVQASVAAALAARCLEAVGQDRKESSAMLRLGLVTYNVAKDWDLDTVLRLCKEAGLEGVEFRTTHAHGVEPALSPAQRAEVRSKCADAGMRQLSLGSVCEFHSPDPAVVRRNIDDCRRFAELARDVGARAVKVRPNGLPREVAEEKTLEQIGKALGECGAIAADCGVEIWVEVHGNGTSLPRNCRAILDACGHPSVGITWNSNQTDLVNGSVREAFGLLGRHIRCCHITELWGAYPYRELFGLLRGASFDGFTLCEVGTSVRAEDGAVFLKCYRGLWKELQRP